MLKKLLVMLMITSCSYKPIVDNRGLNGKEVSYRYNDDPSTCKEIAKEKGGVSDAFLSGYSLAIKDLGILVPDWKHEKLSNANNPKVFQDEEGETNENS